MKFTKLIASLAAITTMVSMMAPAIMISQVNASTELQDAHAWLYEIGATSKATLDAFAPSAGATRAQAAKFLSVVAMELGLDSQSDQTCDYLDLNVVDQTLVDSINTACEMGIFKAQENFNGNSAFLRKHAELTVARMVHGMDEVNAYMEDNNLTEYAAAREMLMDDGIITMNINPDAAVVRGDFAIMMYRMSDMDFSGMGGECIEGIDCPVLPGTGENNTGEVVEVKNGNLELSLGAGTPANNTQIPSTGTVRFAVVNFTAGNADVSVRSVKIAKMGLATIPSTTRIWFEKNGVRVSGKAAFTSEGNAIVSFAPAYSVKAGATEMLDLYVELATVPGYDLQFQSTMVDSSALSTNGGFTTPTLRTVNYSVITTTIAMASTGTTTSATNNGMELGAFTVAVNNASSETRNASFKSITLRQNGNADLVNLGNIVLERNGLVVSTNASINGRDLTFSINDTILDGVTATYYVKAVVNDVDQTIDTYNFSVRNISDVNIVEATTAFRTTVPGTATFGTYSINGGDITFTRTSSSLATSVAPGTTNVTLMQGTMKSNGVVNVEDPTIAYATALMTDSGAYLQFSTVYLTIGGSTFSYSPTANGTATGAAFLGSATINGTVPVRMYATLKTTAPAGSIKFDALRLNSFGLVEYSNGNAVTTAVGSIEGINLTIESSTLNVTRTDGKGSQVIAKGTSDFTVLKMGLTSNQGNGVRVSRAQFDITASGSYTNNIDLSLYINGSSTPSSTKTLTSNEVTFDGFNTLINATTPATFEIKANFREAYSGGAFQITLPNDGLMAIDAMTSSPVAYSSVASSTFTIGTADAIVSASNDPILSQLLVSPSTVAPALMTFKIQALNDTINIKDLNFTGTNLDKLSNFRLMNSGTVVATATTATSGVVTFANLATNATSIAKDQTVTYTVVANVNSNTSGTVSMHLNSAVVRGTNGVEVTPTSFTVVNSSTHAISENTLSVAKANNPSKSLTTSALRFDVTAAGKDFVTLTGIAMSNATVGYTTGTVMVYKGDMNHFAGSGLVTDPVIAISANGIVDAGTTVTYYVAIEGALINSTARDRSVSLNNVYFDGYAAASYKNTGTFSITEVK